MSRFPWLPALCVCVTVATSLRAAETDVTPPATVLHVSPAGRDVWSGRRPSPNLLRTDGPVATLQGARDRLRFLRQAGAVPGAVTVLVHPGAYRLAEPLVFESQDSGTPEAPVTYAAAGPGQPLLSGGRRLVGWHQAQDDTWVTDVPEARAGTWLFRQLFVNGQRRPRARSPNAGFFTVDGAIENTWQWGRPPEEGKPSVFKYRGSDIRPEWAAPGDVEVVALQAWAELRMQIRAVDAEQHTVTLAGPSAPSNREGNARYWVENAIDCLDAPGEWYLDRAAGRLSYRPLPGEDPNQVEIVAPALSTLVVFRGDAAAGQTVHDITLQGLALAHADWALPDSGWYTDVQAAFDIQACVYGYAAVRCAIERCRFSQVGAWAIEFARGSKANRVDRCEMTDIGAGGVKLGDVGLPEDVAQQTSGNTVGNCSIHDIGVVYPAAVGVWIGQSYANRIAHNAIFDTGYSAISVGWTWGYGPTLARDNAIEFNHLYNISRGLLSDLGAVYTLGVQPGTVIRNNLVHDVDSYGYGGWGLYNDEGSGQIVLENNVVYRTKSGGFHHHYGKENLIRNNVFALGREAQLIRSRPEAHRSFTFEHNIVFCGPSALLGSNWADDKFALDYNLYWSTRPDGFRLANFAEWTLAQWQARGFDVHSLVADPLFVDAANDDFRLKEGSPALALGFQPIDVRDVGPALEPPRGFDLLGPRGRTTPLPTFAWEPSANATEYRFLVSRDPGAMADGQAPGGPVLDVVLPGSTTRYVPTEPLPPAVTLSWAVVAVNRRGRLEARGGPLQIRTTKPLDWWDRRWACRRRLVLAPPALTGPLADFPVLLRFTAADTGLWDKMSPDGRDLRVVEQDARGHWHELDLEIERLDPGAKTAEMWVRIPQLTAGPGQYAWLYYGNPAATLPAETAATVWNADFRGVWHLAGSAPPLCDSTRLARHLSASGTPELAVPGAVGPAVRFHTSPDALVTPLLAGEPMTQATLSCWLKAQRQPDGATIVRLPGILLQAWFGDKVNPGVQSSVPYPEGWGGFGWVPEVPVLDDTWHLLALTYDGRCQRYYVDGTLVAQKPFGGDLAGPTAGPTVGGAAGGTSLKGDLDEVRVSGVAVSGERLRAEFECQRPGSRFVTVTAEEARP